MHLCEILRDFADGYIDRRTAASLLLTDGGFTTVGVEHLLDHPEAAIHSYRDVYREVHAAHRRLVDEHC